MNRRSESGNRSSMVEMRRALAPMHPAQRGRSDDLFVVPVRDAVMHGGTAAAVATVTLALGLLSMTAAFAVHHRHRLDMGTAPTERLRLGGLLEPSGGSWAVAPWWEWTLFAGGAVLLAVSLVLWAMVHLTPSATPQSAPFRR